MSLNQQISELFKVVQEGDATRLRELLEGEPSLANTENSDGLTPLGFAAHFGQKNAVQVLIDYGAAVNAVSHSKLSFIPSNTALHAAIAGGSSREVIELLIAKGADVNAVDSLYHAPLQACAFEGKVDIAKLLIESGADISRNTGHGSAMSIAKKHEHHEFAELLRLHGAVE
jgi:ankyrin repeat protein